MTQPVRVAIHGASGRMGRALLAMVSEDGRFTLVRALVAPGSNLVGQLIEHSADRDLRYTDDWVAAPPMDVLVDFSSPTALSSVLDHCLARKIALVSGTTGVDAALERRLDNAGNEIPVLRAANFSLGVAVLSRLLREAAAALAGWDLEIIEAHHGRKRDAPSGTALALGNAAADARKTSLQAAAVYGREGQIGERAEGSIGFAVVRGGDIVGEHAAMLIGQGERLELTHRATDRSIFARGALQAAFWIASRDAGQWHMDDVLSTSR